jgi:hypothetical protein
MASMNSQYQVRNEYNATFAATPWQEMRKHTAVWRVTFTFAVLAINVVDPQRQQPNNHNLCKERRFRFLVRYHDSKLQLTCV